MELFDTHFHCYGEHTPQTLAEASREHLKLCADALSPELPENVRLYMLAAGGDYEESLTAKTFADTVPDAFFACGVHPHQAEEFLAKPEDFSIFRNAPKLVSIGEIGLDYFYGENTRKAQLELFDKFLALALLWDKPAMLHLRDLDDRDDAYCDAYERLQDFSASGGRFVIHCCTAKPEFVEKFLALGAMIGVTGMITFRGAANIREMLKIVPDDRLFIETDAPYLAPVPFRGKENTPGLVALTAEKLACERNTTIEKIAALTTGNAKRFYNITD